MSNGYYARYAFSVAERPIVINEAVAILSQHLDEFDAVACRSRSGCAVGPVVAHLLNKELYIVGRSGSRRLSSSQTEEVGYGFQWEDKREVGHRYVIVDDLISGGDTIDAIKRSISAIFPNTKPVAIYLWADSSHWKTEHSGLPVWNRRPKYELEPGKLYSRLSHYEDAINPY